MRTERDFYDELGKTPELPPHLYASIRKRVSRRASFSRALLAAAAALVFALGATSYRVLFSGNDDRISSEVAAELQTVLEYCNGEDLAGELETYAIYQNEITPAVNEQ